MFLGYFPFFNTLYFFRGVGMTCTRHCGLRVQTFFNRTIRTRAEVMNLSEQNSGVCASTNLPALPSQRAQPVTKNVMFLIFQTKRYRDFGNRRNKSTEGEQSCPAPSEWNSLQAGRQLAFQLSVTICFKSVTDILKRETSLPEPPQQPQSC